MSEVYFGKVLQGLQQSDDILNVMQKSLRDEIDKAKAMANSCKVPVENDEISFVTNSSGELIMPEFKADTNYNEQFWKTYLKNEVSFNMIKEYSEKTAVLQEKVEELEKKQEEYFKAYKIKNRKKNRRLAVEIEKNFTCPYDKCYKTYGSDVSLNLHIKIKHNGGNKTDREKLAEEICVAEAKGQQFPKEKIRLNLPPGYLEEFRESFSVRR